jgi:two-component system response regulator HydG
MPMIHDLLRRRRPHSPIVGVVAGSGQIALCATRAEADFIMVLNAGLYRTLGAGSLASFLPYGNANEQTLHLLREEILPQAGSIPIVAGVFAADPEIDLDRHLRHLRDLGVAGVTNWPALGFIDGAFREAIAQEGIETAGEIDMLRRARAAGIAPFGFVCNADDAGRFAPESDALVLNLGLTRHVRDVSDRRDQVQAAIARLNRMLAAVGGSSRRPLCLAFGGPITIAEDFQQLARQSPIDGFAGGSVFERIPVQDIVESMIRGFRGTRLGAEEGEGPAALGDLAGRSEAMRRVLELVRRIAPHDVGVCIEGETGSGKELVAALIHRLSPRAHESLVTLNCGAIPDSLLESELFGHERGAFTGADRRRLGKFELAHRGTLFLDEVADLSPRAQVALLRAIQQREITRVGGEGPFRVDVRIIAASNQGLARLVREGRFRADLYHRLDAVTVRVPPLRERREDIRPIAESILARLEIQLDRRILGLSEAFREKLLACRWPGNVRDLEHVLCRAALLEDGPVLDGKWFDPAAGIDEAMPPAPAPLPGRIPASVPGYRPERTRSGGSAGASGRRAAAVEAIRGAGGNKSRAAAALGISRKTLYVWLGGAGQPPRG